MDVLVLVPGFEGGGQDGVPDHGFGGGVRAVAGRVGSFYVEEYLFRVPVVEAGEVWGTVRCGGCGR